MTQITGGEIAYTRRVKTGDYEHRDVVVKLNFSAAEGDVAQKVKDFIDYVGETARAKGEELATGARTPQVTQTTGSGRKAPKIDTTPVKTDPALLPEGEPVRDPRTVKPAADPLALDDPAAVAETPPAQAAPSTAPTVHSDVSPDPAAVDDFTAIAPEIKDTDLVAKITAVNARIKNAVAIRTLIGAFVGGPPKGAMDIPQGLRADFMRKLDALA